MSRPHFAEIARRRLAAEHGLRPKEAPFRIGLVFACPYRLGTSALGPMQIYRLVQEEPGMACERIYLPDDARTGPLAEPVRSMETQRGLEEFSVVAITVAYELELGPVAQMLDAAGGRALREERDERFPLVIAGGPLTYANPRPLAAFADAIVLGEADELAPEVFRTVRDAPSHSLALAALGSLPSVYVPAVHGDRLPELARAPGSRLPAWSPLWTAESELANMFLVEAVRGCARSCGYCVMRRSGDRRMRVVPPEQVLSLVPSEVPRVGLVGAGVSDHPGIASLVRALVDRGHHVGLSSLRPDRLDEDLVEALRAGGARSLTVALDGASARLRAVVDRRSDPADVLRGASIARRQGLARIKLYVMVGLPGERDEDLEELCAFVDELSRILPVAVAASPFCPKHNTPLAEAPFAGIREVQRRLKHLRTRLRGRADVRAASARWAWVEHRIAQGDERMGHVVREAVREGGDFRAYRAGLEAAADDGPPEDGASGRRTRRG